MSEKTRGVFQIIIKSFVSSFKRQPKAKFMGEDHFGTKFYEEPRVTGRKTRGRYFEPAEEENFEQEITAEWESWLRYRRKEPPTKEEVEANYRLILMKRENAAELEIKYGAKEKLALESKATEKLPGSSFPVYEEYKESFKKPIIDPKK